MKAEQTDPPCIPITVHAFGLSDEAWNALFDRVGNAAHALDEQLFTASTGACRQCEDEPDWADVRESARKAGWTSDTWTARDVHWGQRDPKRSLRTDLGWVSSRHFQGHHRLELHGPEPRPIRTVALIDPTPAEVLAAARLVCLGGSDV